MGKNKNNLIKDVAIVLLSIMLAVLLVKTQALARILTSTKEMEIIGSFIAGMFFTSIFTTVPAIVTLGEIAQANSVILTAFFGGMGAVVGDLIIFRFVRDRFSEDLMALVATKSGKARLKSLFRLKIFRWLTFLIGGIIIASPLPDELGISFLGFSKTKTSLFIPLSFLFNFFGILIIGFVAKSIM